MAVPQGELRFHLCSNGNIWFQCGKLFVRTRRITWVSNSPRGGVFDALGVSSTIRPQSLGPPCGERPGGRRRSLKLRKAPGGAGTPLWPVLGSIANRAPRRGSVGPEGTLGSLAAEACANPLALKEGPSLRAPVGVVDPSR